MINKDGSEGVTDIIIVYSRVIDLELVTELAGLTAAKRHYNMVLFKFLDYISIIEPFYSVLGIPANMLPTTCSL